MDSHSLNQHLRLRLLIGFLGERTQYGWWPTSFFGTSSGMFLEPVFPKTARLAQYHGVTQAARRLHDEHIGVGSVFHLFRLPEEAEQSLHSAVIAGRERAELFASLEDKETALRAVAEFVGGIGEAHEGPTAVGEMKDLFTAGGLKRLAGCYLAAFRGGGRTYPYFMS